MPTQLPPVDLPPLPPSSAHVWTWRAEHPGKYDAFLDNANEPYFTADQMHAYLLADRASRQPAALGMVPLTEECVHEIWDTYVGSPTARYPITEEDFHIFARAIQRAHGIAAIPVLPTDAAGEQPSPNGAEGRADGVGVAVPMSLADENIGRWLSASLDDPKACDEFKADVRAWFDSRTADWATTPQASATPPQPAPARCPNCDDTGQVSSITGEWRGRCHCPAGQTASPMFAAQPASPDVAKIVEDCKQLANEASSVFWRNGDGQLFDDALKARDLAIDSLGAAATQARAAASEPLPVSVREVKP